MQFQKRYISSCTHWLTKTVTERPWEAIDWFVEAKYTEMRMEVMLGDRCLSWPDSIIREWELGEPCRVCDAFSTAALLNVPLEVCQNRLHHEHKLLRFLLADCGEFDVSMNVFEDPCFKSSKGREVWF